MAPPTAAERGREVRTRLLAAAGGLIGELGWTAVSTRIVAERAGVRPGLVHYHFESLQDLLRKAALDVMRPLLDGATTAFEAAPTPADGAEALLASLDELSGDTPEALLFTEAFMTATRDKELRAAMAELVAAFHTSVSTALARAGHKNPDAAATLLMTALDGYVLHKSLNPALSTASIAPLIREFMTP
ncbi:TetR/AcrR family transcriptional regulator [Streptomyces sp. TRM49041]|uniref:TetR/AcrR family transcriptional regulator n=1 Tax=Streptomyces sp. TRM49041 TaxID=2603216 RepID=UPI0011EE070B|nr:TetR/AcrR family transcriptional regulator [Streptomyces sp. TRM49041]